MDIAMTERCQVRLPADLKEALEEEARRQMISESAIVRRAVARELGLLEQLGTPQRSSKAVHDAHLGDPKEDVI